MSCPGERVYPLRKPPNHKLPVPRFHHRLRAGIDHIFTTYIGIQVRSDGARASQAGAEAVRAVQEWLEDPDSRPAAWESFALIDGVDQPGTSVWVCYFDDESRYNSGLTHLNLDKIHAGLDAHGRASVGLWRESFKSADARLETNYSGTDYLPGLCRLPGTTAVEHELATYWGAARDRIPDSAHDLFEQADEALLAILPEDMTPRGTGQHLSGTNYANLVHIRSGQFWETCGAEEAAAYEQKLEPALRAGLAYLWEHERETGSRALRYLRNQEIRTDYGRGCCGGQEEARKESCGAGFFTSLGALERWSRTHRSHLAIYGGALAHYKAFPGERRRLRTWHEVSVLRAGDARFEYVNCAPRTGVIGTLKLDIKDIR
ncbi:uncharacterized protein E0L32_003463 [Thyridium curvatum]|uniref:Phenylacetaldoxime dehydratase n=1 Tax=Thyridium curvatum TaxID=1093900 RepID=A0A507BIQ8_9PEZI|nr:uncharacterized protein E0L32_003463 [Thyridium curvatum]TPX16901.1 hypothetical protein E0L32_003463 [Thyridium curvatum]